MAEPIVVVGGTVAAAVAAERLAARGERVRWLHAGAPVGAGFRRAEIGGRMLNLGPRLLELNYMLGEDGALPPPWSEYRPGHDGHRPWQALVARYLLELVDGETQAVPDPQLWWRGVRGPDIYFTGDLRALERFLDADALAAVAAETEAILQRGPPGGVHQDGSDLERMDLTAASLVNHGPTFHHALVDVLARRLRRHGTTGVPAALHNKLWIPLYWPRTLWEAAAGRPIGYRPNRTFHVDAHGGMSVPMERLESRLGESPLVTTERVGRLTGIAVDGRRVALEFADGVSLTTERVVLGSAPEELFGAAGLAYAPERLELRLRWIEVSAQELSGEPPSGLTVADDRSPVYRVAAAGDDARPGHFVYAVELAQGHPEPDNAALAAELTRIGFLRAGAEPVELGRRALRAFGDPTLDGRRAFDEALSSFREREGDLTLVGPAAGFGADPLNEQLLQGIRIAEVFP